MAPRWSIFKDLNQGLTDFDINMGKNQEKSMKTCPRCESMNFVSHKPAGEEFQWERCFACGYPLDLSAMINRIKTGRGNIREAIWVEAVSEKKLGWGKTFHDKALDWILNMEDYSRLSPEYEDNDLVVFGYRGSYLIFNFGHAGGYQRYLDIMKRETSIKVAIEDPVYGDFHEGSLEGIKFKLRKGCPPDEIMIGYMFNHERSRPFGVAIEKIKDRLDDHVAKCGFCKTNIEFFRGDLSKALENMGKKR